MQERVAAPVEIEQTVVERDIAAQIDVLEQTQLGQAIEQLHVELAFTDHDQTPRASTRAQQREDVREQQRVLLDVEAAHRQQHSSPS